MFQPSRPCSIARHVGNKRCGVRAVPKVAEFLIVKCSKGHRVHYRKVKIYSITVSNNAVGCELKSLEFDIGFVVVIILACGVAIHGGSFIRIESQEVSRCGNDFEHVCAGGSSKSGKME